MREIKFRGKDILHKEWHFGSLARDIPQNSYYIIDENYGSGVDVDENTVGQFTGLKDRNGKEIYENMIINKKYIVVYEFCKFILKDIQNGDITDFERNGVYEITGEYLE